MKYAALGAKIESARLAAGLAGQGELARKLGVRQQTVSRWEKGESRPVPETLDQIAEILGIPDAEELAVLAGYPSRTRTVGLATTTKRVVSFDQPFPLMALGAESFENFCAMALELVYRKEGGRVARRGGSGHTQDGIDIEVFFPDGRELSFQCKRHAQFGPQKVRAAVQLLQKPATQKTILLASIASPQAREEVRKHDGWQLLDGEDVTRMIRTRLAKADQIKLVDTFFNGQRYALLGELDPGPWIDADAFFKNLDRLGPKFNHAWDLEGREDEMSQVERFLTNHNQPILVIVGNGGSGKTRLLKAICDGRMGRADSEDIYLLSRERMTNKGFEHFGEKRLLLICDDAHDREDLGLLFDFVSSNRDRVKLIISTRGYGLNRIKQQVRTLLVSEFEEVALKRLSRTASESLARQALKQSNLDSILAEQLARFTQDCPLATVVGAAVIASKPNESVVLTNETVFRAELLGKYAKELVGDVSEGLDRKDVRKVLCAFALLQPIFDGDVQLLNAIAGVSEIAQPDVAQIVQRLRDAGIIYSRGLKSRVVPDLLGEFLIEDSCTTGTNVSTGFAERVMDHAPPKYIENILVNLGKLDWLRSEGDTSQSQLLDGIWSKLVWGGEYSSPHVSAAAAVAYFQPRQALDFAKRLIHEQKINEDVIRIIERAASHINHLPTACRLLWKLGAPDQRPQHQHPHHAMRVLVELATPEPGKAPAYISTMLDFAESLIPAKLNWENANTPLDILAGVFKSAGYTTSSTSSAVHLHPYLVSPSQMRPLRKRAIQICLEILATQDLQRSYAAAATLGEALRFPMPIGGMPVTEEVTVEWRSEFLETLEEIDAVLDGVEVSALVHIKLAEAVHGFAHFYHGPTKELARKIIDRLDTRDTRSQLIRSLVDGWGYRTLERRDLGNDQALTRLMHNAAKRLFVEYPEVKRQIEVLEACLQEVSQIPQESNGSQFVFINFLLQANSKLAAGIAARTLNEPEMALANYLGSALASLLNSDLASAHGMISGIVEKNQAKQMYGVAEAYARYLPSKGYSEVDLQALNAITRSGDESVLSLGATAAHQASKLDQNLGLDLLISANFSADATVAHNFLMWISEISPDLEAISADQFDVLVRKIEQLPDLDDHWAQEILRKGIKRDPKKVVSMLIRRIETEESDPSAYGRPISSGPYLQKPLGLATHADAEPLLLEILNWGTQKDPSGICMYHLGSLANSLFSPFDETLVARLQDWLLKGSVAHLKVVLAFLRESNVSLVDKFPHFVARVLEQALSLGDLHHAGATSMFYAIAVSGLRSGTPGMPFAEDERLKALAQERMRSIGVFDPSYRLYKALLDHADRAIRRQIAEGIAMRDDDDFDS